jgi:hypothetical protein
MSDMDDMPEKFVICWLLPNPLRRLANAMHSTLMDMYCHPRTAPEMTPNQNADRKKT